MSREYDAIVVGGGLAGLTSAAYLCKYGLRTLVCESRQKTGGLVDTFWHQGFAFDAGIRAFENSGIVLPMLKALGIEMELIKNQVTIGIGNRKIKLNSQDSLEEYAEMLTGIFPDNAEEISSIMVTMKSSKNFAHEKSLVFWRVLYCRVFRISCCLA